MKFNNAASQEQEARRKPRYSVIQNVAFMVKLAWKEKEKKVLVLGLSLAVLSTAKTVASLYLSPAIVGLVEKGAPIAELLWTLFFFTVLLLTLPALMAYVSGNTAPGRITLRTVLMGAINRKACCCSYANLLDKKFKDRMMEAYQAVDGGGCAAENIWDVLFGLIENVLTFLCYLLLLLNVDFFLLVVITLVAFLRYRIHKFLNTYWYRHHDEEREGYSLIWEMRQYCESVPMAKDIRLFSMRPWIEKMYAKGFELCDAFQRKYQNVLLRGPLSDLILDFLLQGLIYAYLIYLVLNGRLNVSSFLLYFTAANSFSGWISGILDNSLSLYQTSLSLSFMREFLDYPEPFTFEGGVPLTPDPADRYEITFEDVSYRYENADQDTLSHICLTLHPGEKLAVVGLNGAGKTTLVKLLCGFLDPTKGRILLNGTDIRTYNRRDYYRLFSAVFQFSSLLPASVAVNVAQNDGAIDEERLRRCVAQAGLQEKIESLPLKYDTLLDRQVYDDAIQLSGGEIQRLMLARALYKDAPFIILDEPTAALDPLAEADMYRKYHEMTKERSSLYISHRLASTRFCDRIILIENGTLAEEGTHEQLLALGGSYARLFRVQSRYYQEGEMTDVRKI